MAETNEFAEGGPAQAPLTPPAPPPGAPVKQIPVWLSTVVVLAFLAGGGWFTWWYINAPSHSNAGVVGSDDGASIFGWNAARSSRRNPGARASGGTAPRFVHETDDKFRIETSTVYMEIPKSKAASAAPTIDVDFTRRELLYTPEQKDVVLAAVRIQRDGAVRNFLKVTPEQLQKLIQIPAPPLPLTDADRKQLTDLWTAYQSAADGSPKEEAERKLVSTLNQIGDKALTSAKTAAADRAEAIKKVLTPEQLDGFRNMAKRSAPSPAK